MTVATLRLFGPARETAGVARAELPGHSVAQVLSSAQDLYGEAFAAIVAGSRIWLNGEPASAGTAVEDRDEVAVIPPVSGG